jgi:tetratricopeptide (TPR) repeat protein
LSEPPFTEQLDHAEQVQHLEEIQRSPHDSIAAQGLQAAVSQCRAAVEAAPQDHLLQSRLAYLLGISGDLDGASQAARKAVELLPHDPDKWRQLGIALAVRAQHQEACAAYQHSLALRPDDIFTRREYAWMLHQLGQSSEAIDELESTIEFEPGFGPGYLSLGLIYDELGQTEKADAYIHQAVNHRVNQLRDVVEVAKACQQRRWFEEAVKCYLDAVRINQTDPEIYLNLAQCLDQANRLEEAERAYVQSVVLAPGSATTHYLFGVHLAKRELHEPASEQFRAAAELDTQMVLARVNYAMALVALQRLPEALEQFQIVIDQDPNHAVAREYRAAIEKELRQPRN